RRDRATHRPLLQRVRFPGQRLDRRRPDDDRGQQVRPHHRPARPGGGGPGGVTHKVQVTFEGQTGFTIECRADEDVVTAALRQGQIVALDRLCDTVVRVVVRTLAAQDPIEYEPGQYVRLKLPGIGVSRDYSMANLPSRERQLEFLIRVLPGGAFSGYLAERGR